MNRDDDYIVRLWEEWESETTGGLSDPDVFVSWVLENRKFGPKPQDVRKLLRAQVTKALRQVLRTDKNGITYRGKQCVRFTAKDGVTHSMWFDTDTGTRNLMSLATSQKRKAVASYCYRAKRDVDHFNSIHPKEEPIQFWLDFGEDVAELEAADRGKRTKSEDEAA